MTVYYISILAVVVLGGMAQSLRTVDAATTSTTPGRLRQARWVAVMAFVVLAFVGAFRWRVGTDYWAYAGLYSQYAAEPWREWTLTSEPGLSLIAKLAVHSGDDYAVMFGIAAVLITGLAVATIYRASPHIALSLLLFVLTGPWLGSFNGVRQYLAIAVVFYAHRWVLERKFLKYAAAVLVAGLFHISAFLMLLLYFVPRRRLSVLTSVVVLGAAWAATALYDRFLEAIIVFREDADFGGPASYFTEAIDPLRIAVAIAPLIFYAVVTDKKALKLNEHFYVHLLLVNAAILLASAGSAYIARFGAYTGIFLCLAIPSILPTRNPGLRVFCLLVMVPLYAVFWYVDVSQQESLVNFQWIFDRPEGQ